MQKVLCRFRWHTSVTDIRGRHNPDLCVHVSPIHINLSAVLVNDLANLFDRFFKNPVRRGIGSPSAHSDDSGELCFGLQVRQIDAALLIAGDDDDFLNPDMIALAGFAVPCADCGMRQYW
jgi:hypothetical protein